MSQENVELTRLIYDETREYTAFVDPAASEAVWEGLRSRYDPEFEIHAVTPEGARRVHRGTEGYLAFMRDGWNPGRATQSRARTSSTLSQTAWP